MKAPRPTAEFPVIHLHNVIQLADYSPFGVLNITEVEPCSGKFPGKRIGLDGIISPYPHVTLWKHWVVRIPATIPHVFLLVHETLRGRNVCWILGTHADPQNWPVTRKWKAFVENRGLHGFIDKPTRLYTKISTAR